MSIDLDVRMSVVDLLEKVKTQRDKHEKAYEEAIKGWRSKLKVVAQKMADNADKINKFPQAMDALSDKPRHYLETFDEAIDMLSMTKDTEVKLNSNQFNQLVRGKWHWATAFVSANSSYVGYTGATGPTGAAGSTGHTGRVGVGGAIAGDDISDAFGDDDEDEDD